MLTEHLLNKLRTNRLEVQINRDDLVNTLSLVTDQTDRDMLESILTDLQSAIDKYYSIPGI